MRKRRTYLKDPHPVFLVKTNEKEPRGIQRMEAKHAIVMIENSLLFVIGTPFVKVIITHFVEKKSLDILWQS